jgi:hypothetical protein
MILYALCCIHIIERETSPNAYVYIYIYTSYICPLDMHEFGVRFLCLLPHASMLKEYLNRLPVFSGGVGRGNLQLESKWVMHFQMKKRDTEQLPL